MIECPRCYTPTDSKESIVNCLSCDSDFENIDDSPIFIEEDKPTSINSVGTKFWRNKKGRLHRENGPAIEWNDGGESWYKDGKCHRIDGPAVTCGSNEEYWINGKQVEKF